MAAPMVMLRRVLAGRAVAASYVAAFQAEAQVYPAHALGKALLAAGGRMRRDGMDVIQVRALLRHRKPRVRVDSHLVG